jgi:hypothetical protein
MKRFLPLFPLLLLGAAPAAHAAIVYSGVQNVAVPQNFTGIYVNMLTNTTAGTQPVDFNSAPWVGFSFGGVDISNDTLLQVVITGTDQVTALSTAQTVGSPSSFSSDANYSTTHTGPAAGQFQLGSPGYFGFKFQTVAAGPTHYGWAKLTVNNAGAGTLHDWAYEAVAGTSIQVGTVPEPGSALLMLLGFGALYRQRSRRTRAR